MKGFDLIITLQDDCIFSERSATEGGHKALDYIPGSALLGAVASRAYPDDTQAAFELFHSGKVRFGNAYPLAGGKRTFPIPACWHQAKGEKAIEHNRMDASKVWRLDKCAGELPDGKQPQQLRAGYIAVDGSMAETGKSFRMKTAIDATTGRAKESVLFGYDSLNAGQHFHAQIWFDAAVSADVVKQVRAVFEQNLLLGRSRSAEYGRATVKILDNPARLPIAQTQGNVITLWLQSDLMAVDAYGQPTLAPAPQDIGLPEGKLLPGQSFLRTRRYSAWNAHKQGYEVERQVISKGSVLVYQLNEPLNEEHQQIIQAGLGLERQAGLGQVCLNPALLDGKQPMFTEATLLHAIKTSEASKPDSELIKWLERSHELRTTRQDIAREAKTVALKYRDFMQSARDMRGLASNVQVGPSNSQWGAVLAAAKTEKDLQTFLDSANGSCKRTGEGWKELFWQDSQRTSFYDWFIQQHIARPDRRFIQHLVREVMAEIKKDQRGGRA
jgi:CRISPR-associated protein Csx10